MTMDRFNKDDFLPKPKIPDDAPDDWEALPLGDQSNPELQESVNFEVWDV